jgi:hypothetical protein
MPSYAWFDLTPTICSRHFLDLMISIEKGFLRIYDAGLLIFLNIILEFLIGL